FGPDGDAISPVHFGAGTEHNSAGGLVEGVDEAIIIDGMSRSPPGRTGSHVNEPVLEGETRAAAHRSEILHLYICAIEIAGFRDCGRGIGIEPAVIAFEAVNHLPVLPVAAKLKSVCATAGIAGTERFITCIICIVVQRGACSANSITSMATEVTTGPRLCRNQGRSVHLLPDPQVRSRTH